MNKLKLNEFKILEEQPHKMHNDVDDVFIDLEFELFADPLEGIKEKLEAFVDGFNTVKFRYDVSASIGTESERVELIKAMVISDENKDPFFINQAKAFANDNGGVDAWNKMIEKIVSSHA